VECERPVRFVVVDHEDGRARDCGVKRHLIQSISIIPPHALRTDEKVALCPTEPRRQRFGYGRLRHDLPIRCEGRTSTLSPSREGLVRAPRSGLPR
jgi:hypothetical protein